MNTASSEMAEENTLRQRLADQLAQRVGIVGVEAHHFAVGVGIEIADGQQSACAQTSRRAHS